MYSAQFWLNLQAQYDLQEAQEQNEATYKLIPKMLPN
jgi:plasmid maintenance system antidote protein VapI